MKTQMIVPDFIRRARSVYRDSPAVVCGAERLTYGDMGQRVNQFSNALRKLGVKRGDVVAYISFNCHRLLEAYYAVPQLGAILLPINIRLTPDDVGYILADSGASTIVVDRALANLVTPCMAALPEIKHVILMGGDPKADVPIKGGDYETLLSAASADFDAPDIKEDDVAELFYTSGTTARPKGVILTHRNLYTHAFYALACAHCSDVDTQLHSIPLFHV